MLVVRIADLRDVFDGGGNFIGWAHEDDIGPDQVGLDPQRGRVLLGTNRAAEHASEPFTATFHYGFSRDIGGGEYERTPMEAAASTELTAAGGQALQPLLDQLGLSGGRLLIEDSLTYKESPAFKAPADADPEKTGAVVGAANGVRPLIAANNPMPLEIAADATLVLDGLVISGEVLQLPAAADNAKRTLILRDCTLVPGLRWVRTANRSRPSAPSLIVEHPFAEIILERCITGPLHIIGESGTTVRLKDCIVDAAESDGLAYAADAAGKAGAEISLEACTVIGRVNTRLMRLASNCIFTRAVNAARRQDGCMRFSFVPEGSLTPRRFRCQPDATHPQVLPQFTSLRYGEPGYCQLRASTARVIREGAERRRRDGRHASAVPAAARNQPADPPRRVPAIRPARGPVLRHLILYGDDHGRRFLKSQIESAARLRGRGAQAGRGAAGRGCQRTGRHLRSAAARAGRRCARAAPPSVQTPPTPFASRWALPAPAPRLCSSGPEGCMSMACWPRTMATRIPRNVCSMP